MKPYQSCLVVTTQRTGSWMLADALYATGSVGRPEEFFRPHRGWIYYQAWGLPPDPRITDVVRKAVEAGTSRNGVFGAKLHWHQWSWLVDSLRDVEDVNRDLDDATLISRYLPEPRYVYLRRRDRARQAVSFYRARLTQVWNVRVDEPPPEPLAPDADPDYGEIRWCEQLVTTSDDNWQRFFEQSAVPVDEVVYEDFVADYPGTIARLLRFLDLPTLPREAVPPSSLVRLADEVSERWLEGYLAVRDTIEPSPPEAVLARRRADAWAQGQGLG